MNEEERVRAEDFVQRYTTGNPAEGFDSDEAIGYLRELRGQVPPETLQRAVAETVRNLPPEQRQAFAEMLERRRAGTGMVTVERTGEENPRYLLRRGENESGLEDLRGLPAAIRAAGEKGLQITRFKGLGEMNAEELRDTTLDPTHRTLLQVTMEDAGSAADLFSVLMGDQVEPRREFIQKHALDVRNLDV